MGRFLKQVAESMSERGCTPLILGARELAQAKESNRTIRFLERARVPWLVTYWVLAFQMWIRAGRPVIAVISQEYVVPFGFDKQIPIYHDMIQYFVPRNKKSALFYRYYLPWVTRKLKFVYCVTHATGRMIQRLIGQVSYSVCGVPIEKAFSFPSEANPEGERYRYVWVGTLATHKQYQQALGYMEGAEGAGLRLAMVVPASQSDELKAEVVARGLSERVSVFSNLSEQALSDLYAHSDFVLSTSRLEGFCMPVLEAALRGCKPMVPNRGAFRESFGRFAVLVPPHGSAADFHARGDEAALSEDRAAVREGARDLHQAVLKNSVRAMDELADAAQLGHKEEICRKHSFSS